MGQTLDHFKNAYSLESAQETLEHYAKWAESYDQEVAEENGYAQPQRTAEALAAHLPPEGTVILDAGCGSGLSGLALANAGYRKIDGCDFSPDMLAKAAEKNVYRSLFEADLNEGLPGTENAGYDAVTAVGVFSFAHVMPDACEDLVRVLKQGGFLVIALNEKFWERGDLARKLEELEQAEKLTLLSKEFGEHLPGHGVKGWVIVGRRNWS